MTTTGIAPNSAPTAQAVHGRSIARTALLWCGLLSSVLYLGTDILGGLRYEGYSFFSQAISELGAIGAPSKPFVDPLFTAYQLLVLAFGIGLLREAGGKGRLRIAAVALIAYGAIGFGTMVFAGPDGFAMHQRGTGSVAGDSRHIILTAVLVLFLFIAIGAGANAFGRRFRLYSFATIATMLVFGALTATYAARIAANEPTPGVGVLERIDVYSAFLWIAVLSVALLHRPSVSNSGRASSTSVAPIHGEVAPGFEEVRTEFERNFAERGEIGAAVAAYWRGEKVVDLWGGRRTPNGDAPWDRNTIVPVMSTTKGIAAMTLAIANSRGWLDYDAKVSRYWPEFAQNGKAEITVRQLLGHEAGLVLLDEKLTIEKLRDLDYVARMLARQKPAWAPGTRHGYHTFTIGLYMQELIRHVDPARRSLGRFFRDEIAAPLNLEFYIGLPGTVASERIAVLKTLSRGRALMALTNTPPALLRKILPPSSLLRRSMLIADLDMNDRRTLEIELPAGNGVGTARSIARAYSVFADGGTALGITPGTFDSITAPPAVERAIDEVLGIPSYFSLGFLRPGPEVAFGSNERAFGSPGAGGSFAFADPDARIGYAYVMNKMNFYLSDDPREKSLRDALYRAIARLGDRIPISAEKASYPETEVRAGVLTSSPA